MKIPFDTSEIKAKLKTAFNNPKKTEVVKTGDDPLTRRTMSKIAEEKAKRKALADELANTNTTVQRKQEIIDGLQAQLDAAIAEKEELSAKVETLTPKAKAWSSYENKERAKLLANFPPELQSKAKKISEGMDIDTFRDYATTMTGKTTTKTETGGKDGQKDWKAILDGNPEEANKAIEADPAGFNAYMETVK